MSQAARNVVGAVGDIRNRCELLLDHLRNVEGLVTGYEDYPVNAEAQIQDANWRWSTSAGDYVDRAVAAVDEWRSQVLQAIQHDRQHEGELMGNLNVKVSDLTGRLILDDGELATVRVIEHPALSAKSAVFEAAHAELKGLDKAALTVAVIEVALPNEESKRLVLEVAAFDKLATTQPMAELLSGAVVASTPKKSAGVLRGERIDYASLEHAGRPHKGRTTEAEAATVREHLAAINERLVREGHRQIDPANPEHAARYGFPTQRHQSEE